MLQAEPRQSMIKMSMMKNLSTSDSILENDDIPPKEFPMPEFTPQQSSRLLPIPFHEEHAVVSLACIQDNCLSCREKYVQPKNTTP